MREIKTLKKLMYTFFLPFLMSGCGLFLSDEKEILSFSLEEQAVSGTINSTDLTIMLVVPSGTSVTSLTPTIVHTGITVEPASGASQDFTYPVTYTVTAENGKKTYYTTTILDKPSISAHYRENQIVDELLVAPGAVFELSLQTEVVNGSIKELSIDDPDTIVHTHQAPGGSKVLNIVCSFDPPQRGLEKTVTLKAITTNDLETVVELPIRLLPSTPPTLVDNPFERVIPELAVADGGIQTSSAPSGTVYYFNPLHTKAESDIRLDDTIKYSQYVKRYLEVSGSAVPDDSGYTDRFYHWVLFTTILLDSNNNELERNYTSFPVNSDNRFSGFLYFPKTGYYKVYSFRQRNYNLYPKSTTYSVDEGYSTLLFYVNSVEPIPEASLYLLPSRYVDCGNGYLREYARYLTEHNETDLEKLQSLYHFLVFGDTYGPFWYEYYYETHPNYADTLYSDYYLASHLLINRHGICNDFSELFAALARTLGFQVQLVSGTKTLGEAGHQWNKVWANDHWYRLDATWGNGDPARFKSYAEIYTEFDEETFEAEHENAYTVGYVERY